MENETIAISNSFGLKKPFDSISILVVDDDITCLSIVAAILKKFHYEVVTVKHPNDALCTLRIKGGAFDLVVSDVHMPDMNGFELQKVIAQEFNLPVILMSADDEEGVVLKGLENGAAFFIMKPVCPDDLRDLWQFAAMNKKSQVFHEENQSLLKEKAPILLDKINSDDVTDSSINEDRHLKRNSPKIEVPEEIRRENSESSSQKRPKVVWTDSLHNRFLEAIRSIGLDRAVPKKILEVMNVPGLTRENVASHLQKYRIFLRRVSDASLKIQYAADHKILTRSLRSSLTSSGSNSSISMLSKYNYRNPGRFPGSNSSLYPNQAASPSSIITARSGFGQSRLLSNIGSFLKPNVPSANLLIHDTHRSPVSFAQNSPSVKSHLPTISLENLSDGALSSSFDAALLSPAGINIPSLNHEDSSQKNIGILSNTKSTDPSKSFTCQTNYVGYSIANLKHLTKSGVIKKNQGLESSSGMMNLPGVEFQDNNNITTTTTATTTTLNSESLLNDNITFDEALAKFVEDFPSSAPDTSDGEKQLADVIADYQMLIPSNLPLPNGIENGVEIQEPVFTPFFDFDAFDILSTEQSLEKVEVNTTFADQMGFENQEQMDITQQAAAGTEGLANPQEFGSSSDQINKTFLSASELEENEFLESLLVSDSFGEDQTLDGI